MPLSSSLFLKTDVIVWKCYVSMVFHGEATMPGSLKERFLRTLIFENYLFFKNPRFSHAFIFMGLISK